MSHTNEVQANLKEFGANLRRARVARALTQEALSEKADLHIRVLQKMEAGESNILMTTLVRLQKALGCPWHELLAFPQPDKKNNLSPRHKK
ncbi:MAG: helix-turn-helix domain-containing protein [Kiritimatiellaeota bacterium]|nr:helix-turn-helix domain-containing protein [Kiritimatiellota bacterium]